MSGLFIAAFLCHFLGFVGPFAAVGILSILLTIFMNRLVDFVDTEKESALLDKQITVQAIVNIELASLTQQNNLKGYPIM